MMESEKIRITLSQPVVSFEYDSDSDTTKIHLPYGYISVKGN